MSDSSAAHDEQLRAWSPAAECAAPRHSRTARIMAALISAGALLLSGCTALPTHSQPQAIGAIQHNPAETEVPEPTPGIDAFPLVREFIKASAQPAGRHAAARQFLTTEAESRWNDSASTTIANRVDVLSEGLRSDNTATFIVRAEKVGQLSPDGVFTAEEGTVETKISVVRVEDEWRIDDLPSGVIIERPHFLSHYERQAIYFLDPTGRRLVPDLRWVAVNPEQIVPQLMAMLMDGPSTNLAPGVTSQFSEEVRLRGPITKADGRTTQVGVGLGGIKMDLQGLAASGADERRRLAAQIIWTLDHADIPGPYVIEADGAPLDESLPTGWTRQDVASMDPNAAASADVGLHAIFNGALVSVTDSAVSPVPGTAGALDSLDSGSISHDGKQVAVITRNEDSDGSAYQLLIGAYGGALTVAAEGSSITRPSWSASDNSLWAVIDGDTVIRVVREPATGEHSALEVESGAIAGLQGQITSFRLAPDGVRAALIVGGKVYVAAVAEPRQGLHTLLNPKPVALNLTDTAVALDWGSTDSLLVVRNSSEAPVARVTADGSRVEQLPRGNLSPPVTAVDASPTTEYVTDSRGVLRLGQDEPDGERFWREVSRLMGVDAKPILPG
ncbi:MtrAB system accessory lipoprotein LpqB [Hoyosella subflava]|uniref:Lipoprotein LpqB n=1 Tax=Hoyosella subflava (strain DSM 45089 / JCM 17490 / NBRC 109087 / DQS3-9A1) TaxID=443218 RepID=F6EFW4_HOYSD|nr:MtrAB system accessory lipoprotein LpqB [Hoyosella subflava]AEF42228.1 Lipoprotein LpqB [Hoyosella subflava DQS3-9A1]